MQLVGCPASVCARAFVDRPAPAGGPQGNTSTKRGAPGDGSAAGEDAFASTSPPCSPGSPLTYSPQIPMEPIPKVDQAPLGRDHAAEFHGLAGWPAQPKLVPTVIVCAPRAFARSALGPRVGSRGSRARPAACGTRSLRSCATRRRACRRPPLLKRLSCAAWRACAQPAAACSLARAKLRGPRASERRRSRPRAQGATAAAAWRWGAPSTTGPRGTSCSAPARTSPS